MYDGCDNEGDMDVEYERPSLSRGATSIMPKVSHCIHIIQNNLACIMYGSISNRITSLWLKIKPILITHTNNYSRLATVNKVLSLWHSITNNLVSTNISAI